MAEPDPAGIGGMLGGNEASSVFKGTADVKVNYKDVTGLTKQMDLLAQSVKRVHDALGTLNEPKIQKALAGLQGSGKGAGFGTAGAAAPNAGDVTFSGSEGPPAQGGGGGFMGISPGWRKAGMAFAGATALAGAYDRRAQGDLSSDVLAMRTVYTSDRPGFGLHQATAMNARQFGPYSLGREDAQQGAAAIMGRYGPAGGPGQTAAAGGAGVFAMSSFQGSAFGAQTYNALNDPGVLNRMRMFGGPATAQVKDVTGFARSMARVTFGTESPTTKQLTNFRPGTMQYQNMLMMTGGDPMLATQMQELMLARNKYEQMGSPRGKWSDEVVRSIGQDDGLQKQLFGEKSLYLSRQKFEAGKGMRSEELLNMSRSGLVTTNELLATISSNTFDMTKALQALAGPLGNLAGGLGGGMGAMGQVLNVGTDIAMMRALGGGGGGGFAGRAAAAAAGGGGRLSQLGAGLGLTGAGGMFGGLGAAAAGAGGLGLAGSAGILGLGAIGGQAVDSMIGNPRTKKGFDVGNVARYTAMGAAIGTAIPIPGIGTLAGAAGGLGVGLLREGLGGLFGAGDPIDAHGYGGIGDPVPQGQQPGGGMNVSQAEDLLKSRGGHVSGVAGLASDFKIKLATLFAQNPRLSLSSGARTTAEQTRLYQRWINKVPGQAPAAKPGSSNHEFGLAADIGPSSEYGWLASNAPRVGLVKPMDYEPWHWEPPGAKSRRGSAGAETGSTAATDAGMEVGPSVIGSKVDRVGPESGAKGPIRAASLSGTAISAVPGGGMSVSGGGGGGGGGGGAAGGIGINAVARAARAAGLPESEVATAVAIAMAESSLNASAHNPVPPDDSYGLWQINMIGNMGPSRRKSLGINKNEELFNPNVNARAMMQISGGGHNWKPWSTYGNNAYKGHLASVQTALQTGVGDPVEPTSARGGALQQPMIVSAGGRGGVTIQAPIYLTVKDASDAEAERFARKVSAYLDGIVADINNARTGV